MNAIGNVQARDPGNAFQIERHERDVVLARQLAVDVTKLGRVGRSEIGWCFHTCEDHLDAFCLRARDDLAEIALQLFYWQATQFVVGPELDDKTLHIAGERPVESAQS